MSAAQSAALGVPQVDVLNAADDVLRRWVLDALAHAGPCHLFELRQMAAPSWRDVAHGERLPVAIRRRMHNAVAALRELGMVDRDLADCRLQLTERGRQARRQGWL